MSVLEQWDKFIDEVLLKIKQHPRLWGGDISRDTLDAYLSFYGVHGGLFIESSNDGLDGFMTVHPGAKDVDWAWDKSSDSCTVHLCWARTKAALRKLMLAGLKRFNPKSVHYIRDGFIFHLTPKKVERLSIYGRR